MMLVLTITLINTITSASTAGQVYSLLLQATVAIASIARLSHLELKIVLMEIYLDAHLSAIQ